VYISQFKENVGKIFFSYKNLQAIFFSQLNFSSR